MRKFFIAFGASLVAADVPISALQWNPHWECFSKSGGPCKTTVERLLTERLQDNVGEDGTDFANVVMFEDPTYTTPQGFEKLSKQCGQDVTVLFWDASRWRKSAAQGGYQDGCMDNNDRSYVLQAFEHLTQDFKVIVIGAHFPHGDGGRAALKNSIQLAATAAGTDNAILIADTNINIPSVQVATNIGFARASSAISTDLKDTCCLNDGFNNQFDRVIANVGSNMEKTEFYDQDITKTNPQWAIAAFHRAIRGRFTAPASPQPAPEGRTPVGGGCFTIKDRSECCKHTDGRAGAPFYGFECRPSKDNVQFNSGNVCEPIEWIQKYANLANLGSCGGSRRLHQVLV